MKLLGQVLPVFVFSSKPAKVTEQPRARVEATLAAPPGRRPDQWATGTVPQD